MMWWFELLTTPKEYGFRAFDVTKCLRKSLVCGHMGYAGLWVQLSSKLNNPIAIHDVAAMVRLDLCNDDLERAFDTLKWMVERWGAFEMPAEIMTSLLDSKTTKTQYGEQQVLEWLAVEGSTLGITVPVLSKDLQAHWEVILRAARLRLFDREIDDPVRVD
ncbi:hypothetical protein BC828DRAFT_72768 [Blastocladiella britannica]|nr:hypothetical protein BC828DRAFT_72768 [Blastocladiella britannica]